jgi:hypothetical protein
VAVTDDRLDVVTGDPRGVLAAVTNVLTRDGLVIEHAATATWPDGAVIMTFNVDGEPPAAATLVEQLGRASFVSGSNPIPGVQLSFDDHASPWHTVPRRDRTRRARPAGRAGRSGGAGSRANPPSTGNIRLTAWKPPARSVFPRATSPSVKGAVTETAVEGEDPA